MIVFVGTRTSPERYDIGSPVGAGGQNVRTDFTTPASWPEVPEELAIALDSAVRGKAEKPRPSRLFARR